MSRRGHFDGWSAVVGFQCCKDFRLGWALRWSLISLLYPLLSLLTHSRQGWERSAFAIGRCTGTFLNLGPSLHRPHCEPTLEQSSIAPGFSKRLHLQDLTQPTSPLLTQRLIPAAKFSTSLRYLSTVGDANICWRSLTPFSTRSPSNLWSHWDAVRLSCVVNDLVTWFWEVIPSSHSFMVDCTRDMASTSQRPADQPNFTV